MKKIIKESIDYKSIKEQVKRMMISDRVKEKTSVTGLMSSLEKIGDGDISENSFYDFKGDRLIYEELLNNDTLILVVHGAYTGTPYSKFDRGYRYDIGLYRNNPRTVQYGGGYGASGITWKKHDQLLGYSDYDIIHKNENIISEVCNLIKRKVEITESMGKKITLKESELISLIERMIKEYCEETGSDSVGGFKSSLSQGSRKGINEGKKMKGKNPCWDGYEMIGGKKKNGKLVPNCVKKNKIK